MEQRQIRTTDAEQTRRLGFTLGEILLAERTAASHEQPIVIFLHGELGAGKTTFVSGLLRAIGVTGPVRSPTYTLIEPYEMSTLSLYHLDLYRVADTSELELLALKDILLANTVLLVEWAERAESALPRPDLVIWLRYPAAAVGDTGYGDQDRFIDIDCRSALGAHLISKLVK
jgi:tRNA threonylcarbamoyladenosine biosynthesis protein TsaE